MSMKTLAAILCVSLPCTVQGQDVRESVVKIFTTSRTPSPAQPWTRNPPSDSTGTGVVIEGNRILTNAHVARFARQVFVQPYQSSDKLPAHVDAIAPGIDLAILTLEDESFFDGRPVAEFRSDLPRTETPVQAYGYPLGGSDLSTTEGIISRIEFAPYYYGTLGLRIQVDAPLNPGNSGGPVLSDGKVVGLVFSGIPEAENIGYLIPTEEIETFLTDVEDGSYEGKPKLIASLQTVENDALRKRLGVTRDVTGLMLTRPMRGESEPVLRQWDLITRAGDYNVDNVGMIALRDDLRVHFTYAVSRIEGDTIGMTVWRDGAEVDLDVPVNPNPPRLLSNLGDEYPSYFIYGPLVFTPVYSEHIEWLAQGTNVLVNRSSPIATRRHEPPAFDGEQLVTLASPLLPHRLTKGYDVPRFSVLKQVNGVEIRNLRHLVETLRDLDEQYVTFEWFDENAEVLVFERPRLEDAIEEILDDNGIRRQYSDDLRDVWGS